MRQANISNNNSALSKNNLNHLKPSTISHSDYSKKLMKIGNLGKIHQSQQELQQLGQVFQNLSNENTFAQVYPLGSNP